MPDLIRLLVKEYDEDVNFASGLPLRAAIEHSDVDLIAFLFRSGADITIDSGSMFLLACEKCDHFELVRHMIANFDMDMDSILNRLREDQEKLALNDESVCLLLLVCLS